MTATEIHVQQEGTHGDLPIFVPTGNEGRLYADVNHFLAEKQNAGIFPTSANHKILIPSVKNWVAFEEEVADGTIITVLREDPVLAEIAVQNPTPDTETSICTFSYSHIGCTSGGMRWSRDPSNNICSIACSCSLKISFPQLGEASTVIAQVSIDGEARVLSPETYESCQAEVVRILAQNL